MNVTLAIPLLIQAKLSKLSCANRKWMTGKRNPLRFQGGVAAPP
jgi:hypothetical protein